MNMYELIFVCFFHNFSTNIFILVACALFCFSLILALLRYVAPAYCGSCIGRGRSVALGGAPWRLKHSDLPEFQSWVWIFMCIYES